MTLRNNKVANHPAVAVLGMLLLGIALFFLLFAFVTFVLGWTSGLGVVQKSASEEEAYTLDHLRFYAVIVGGIVLVVQLWLTNRRVGAAEGTAKAAVQTAESTVRSNTSQRFKEAIELLGHQSEIVRAGGIEALLFIARDNQDYRQSIAKIIDNYNRHHSIGTETEDGEM